MGLLDVLASDWSVTSRSDGKTVAFTVLEGADPWAAWADGELGREGRQA